MSTASSLPSSVSKPSTGTPRFALVGAAFVLVAGIVLAFVGMRPPPPRTFQGSVKDLLPPAELVARDGWKVEYLPIADTPEAKAKVDELLNYDDAVFAVYTRGTERVSIYLAYWAPGKMSHRLVAGHTPDVCWVGAGWRIVEAKSVKLEAVSGQPVGAVALNGPQDASNEQLVASNQSLVTSNQQLIASNELLVSSPKLLALIAQPGEYREMSLNGRTEHVVFWHLLDGVARSYGIVGAAPWHATFTDLLSRPLNQRPEQLFIRISSNASGLPRRQYGGNESRAIEAFSAHRQAGGANS